MKDRHALAERTRDDRLDVCDVPAAVLCAVCGQADCDGCVSTDDGGSGVIAIVPWERPGSGWYRLWTTSQAATLGAEGFFGALPAGPLKPALHFAIVAELLAVSSTLVVILGLLSLAAPSLAAAIVADESLRNDVLRWLGAGAPAIAMWMVALHALHGAALGRAARKLGAVPRARRALRFGLYACGWDLMTSPLGATVNLLLHGPRHTASLLALSVRVPGRAARALLRCIYGLDEDESHLGARRAAGLTVLVVVLTLVAAFGLALA